MGLDIVVNVSPKEVLASLGESGFGGEVKDVEFAKTMFGNMEALRVHTRPGSYAGLHIVRRKFTDFKNIEAEPLGTNNGIPESHKQYHLLNHSDCDGWYLPDDFEVPVWAGSTSIGSSRRLLAELQEITPKEGEEWAGRWKAVYAAAVASVVTNTPIRFC